MGDRNPGGGGKSGSGAVIRIGLSAALILLFILHSLGSPRLGWLQGLENASYDMRVRLDLADQQDPRIVIADVDEKSLEALGRWPWSRDILADFTDILFEHYDIHVLGFDVLFAEPDTDPTLDTLDTLAEGPLETLEPFQEEYERVRPELDRDRRFAESLEGRDVVLGYVFNQHDRRRMNALPPPLGEIPEDLREQLRLHQPRGFSGNLPQLQESARGGGFFDNPALDADGVYRRVPLIQDFEGELYESLSLAVARVIAEDPPLDLHIETDGGVHFLEALQLGDMRIPLGQGGTVLVPYRGPQNSFPYVSIIDILEGRVPPEALAGRVVLVGTTSPGLMDLRTTPVGTSYPGVEVHANLLAGLLDGTVPEQPEWFRGIELLLILLTGLATLVLATRLSPLFSLLATGGLLGLLVGGNLHAWRQGMVLPLAAPVLLVVALYATHAVIRLFTETRDRRVLARAFGQYVPPELVSEIRRHPESVSLEGESRELTVLFSDVRGFTSISEGLDPEALTRLMNELLTPMTRVIHQHRGTIDKYMGDAIMAFWGAPLEDPEHARHALEAALDMMEAVEEINRSFRQKGWSEINIGAGLNTGTMSVGNMGSQFRMAYTVLGDAVNLGSRLEGLTKNYGVNIIVSDSTREQVPGFAFRALDLVRVKGKEEPVEIFEPLGPESELDGETRDRLERYHQALEHYRNQRWDEADALLLGLRSEEPERKVYSLYLERIGEFRHSPPPADWDGVCTHTST